MLWEYCVRPKFSFMDEMFAFIWQDLEITFFMIVKRNSAGLMEVGLFYISSMKRLFSE